MSKPTLEQLRLLQDKRNEADKREFERLRLAVNLDVCPNCGGPLKYGLLEVLRDIKKCTTCNSAFSYIDCDITY